MFPLDLSNPEKAYEQSKSYFSSKGITVDILINNSGTSMRSFFLDVNYQTEKDMMNLNYFAPTMLARVT